MLLSTPQPYRTIEHTADTAVEVEGGSAEETLGRLILAYADLVTAGAPVPAQQEVEISVKGGVGLNIIAVDVLRAAHRLLATEGRVPSAVSVLELSPEHGARVRLGCGRFDRVKHREGLDIKAVTYHAAEFMAAGGGRYRARVVFDI